MLITETVIATGERPTLEVRSTRNVVDVAAHLYILVADRHPDHGREWCIVDPPRWTWRVAIRDHSVGGALFDLGQRAFRRVDDIPVVYSTDLDWEDLPALGWHDRDIKWVRDEYASWVDDCD